MIRASLEKLNAGGYSVESNGMRYFGANSGNERLYRVTDTDTHAVWYTRATDRKAAIRAFIENHPSWNVVIS